MTNLFIYVLFVMLLIACKPNEDLTDSYDWHLRKNFPEPIIPLDNPMSEAKVKLGRALFYDKNLSANQQQACASCHQQKYSFAEPLAISVGSTGEPHRRNAPALVNIAYNKTLTWAHNGLDSIERQLLLPMFGESPVELDITGHEAEVLARFDTPQYNTLFKSAFSNNTANFDRINKSLASFVRSLISFDSPFDRYAYDGDDNALNESEIRGMNLFFSEKLECHHCHGGFNFTQSSVHEKQLLDRRPFHNTGLYFVAEDKGYPAADIGLAEITLDAKDNGRFRAPSLRNISVSAPYMHDGSFKTLSEVVDFYAAGGRIIESGPFAGDGRKNPLKNVFIKGFEISEQEKQDLLMFLGTLTDQKFLTNSAFSEPEEEDK